MDSNMVDVGNSTMDYNTSSTASFIDNGIPKLRSTISIEQLSLNMVNCVFGFIAFMGNLWVIHLFYRFKSLRKVDCVLLIVSMAVSDTIMGLGCMITGVDRIRLQFSTAPVFNKLYCIGIAVPMLIGMFSSQLHACSIAIDRLIAVLDPFKYKTMNHYKMSNIFVVLYTVASCACMFIGVDLDATPVKCNAGASLTYSYRIYWLTFGFMVGFTVVIVYAMAMIILVKKMKAPEETYQNIQKVQLHRQAKITRVLAKIVLLYVVLWVTPNIFYNGATVIGVSRAVLGRLGPYVACGSVLNAASNIIVYGLKHPEIRKYSIIAMNSFKIGSTVAPMSDTLATSNPNTDTKNDMQLQLVNWS